MSVKTLKPLQLFSYKLIQFTRHLRAMVHPLGMVILTCAILCGSANPALARHRKKNKLLDEAARAMDFALAQPPKDLETCFSPDEQCDIKLIKFIATAKKSVDLAIFDINIDQLVHQLLVVSRTAKVRIVVDRRQAKGEHSLVSLLIKAGAQIRFGHQRGIMHDKFTIVDGSMVETGSFNYTNHASQANQENQVYLAHPQVVQRYEARFEKVWSTAREFPPEKKRLSGSDTDQDSEADSETE